MKLSLLLSVFALAFQLSAQDKHNENNIKQDTSTEMHDQHQMMEHDMQMDMNFDKFPGMRLRGSGTAWLPKNAPNYSYMWRSDKWMYMLHGNVFVNYTNQDIFDAGSRGDEKFGSVNWLMGMAETSIGQKGLLRLNAMISLEALTVGGAGYPLLFQTGETWNGKALVDHQHPHDLFSELSVSYKCAFTDDLAAYVYLAYPGEPSLGPVAFMHRPTGIFNPNTPLGHHWQDATHVTFGVATLGLQYKKWKIESSRFTGTEPNEDRYDFDPLKFNSQSYRISFNPSDALSLQLSHAIMSDVHDLGPREDMDRTTASIIHATDLGGQSFLNSTLVWGYNKTTRGHHPSSHSFLAESALTMNKSTIYGRYEWVEKTAGSLLLDEDLYHHDNLYSIQALSLGFQQKVLQQWNSNFSLGLQGRLYFTPEEITDVYGEYPIGAQVYLRIYPGKI